MFFTKANLVFLAAGVLAVAFAAFFFLSQGQQPAVASCQTTARNALPPQTFDNLPEMPLDFCEKLNLVRSRNITFREFSQLGEAYWLQPEVQPTFESEGINAMLNPPQGRWAATGYGAYPSETAVELGQGESAEKVFFFKASWLVESYQGIALNHIILHSNGSVFKGRQTIKIGYSPSEFLLGPAYPVFDQDWVEKITLTLSVDEGTPPGEYAVLLNVKSPSKSREWASQYPSYFDASGLGLNRHFLKLNVIVNN